MLAGHMLPLGPKVLQLNETVAATGMSLFFTLSGFLIVSMLTKNDNVASFLSTSRVQDSTARVGLFDLRATT